MYVTCAKDDNVQNKRHKANRAEVEEKAHQL